MNANATAQKTSQLQTPELAKQKSPTERILSIDVLRGFTIMLMLFVNDLASVPNIAWWSKHYTWKATGMTYVDLVFPAFLFIVGLSIPFAMKKRLQGPAYKAYFHVLIRSASLLLIGFFMVNHFSYKAAGWPANVYEPIMYTSFILLFHHFIIKPKEGKAAGVTWKIISYALRTLGFIGLITCYLVFTNGKTGENVYTGMTSSWWGILGLIGWAYLFSALAYLVFRDNLFALACCAFIFIAIHISHQQINYSFLGLTTPEGTPLIPRRVWWWNNPWLYNTFSHNIGINRIPIGTGTHAGIVMMGLILGVVIKNGAPTATGTSQQGHAARIKFAIPYAICLAIGGYLLTYPWGISKNAASISWALYCSAITVALWVFFYTICDVFKLKKWAAFPALTGRNALLAYILAPLISFTFFYINSHTCVDPATGQASSGSEYFWITPFAFKREVIHMWGEEIKFAQPLIGTIATVCWVLALSSIAALCSKCRLSLKL